ALPSRNRLLDITLDASTMRTIVAFDDSLSKLSGSIANGRREYVGMSNGPVEVHQESADGRRHERCVQRCGELLRQLQGPGVITEMRVEESPVVAKQRPILRRDAI